MDLQTVNELTNLYVALNPCLSDEMNGTSEESETNPTSLSMEANLDGLLIWSKNLLAKIGLVPDFIKRSIKTQELNEQ